MRRFVERTNVLLDILQNMLFFLPAIPCIVVAPARRRERTHDTTQTPNGSTELSQRQTSRHKADDLGASFQRPVTIMFVRCVT